MKTSKATKSPHQMPVASGSPHDNSGQSGVAVPLPNSSSKKKSSRVSRDLSNQTKCEEYNTSLLVLEPDNQRKQQKKQKQDYIQNPRKSTSILSNISNNRYSTGDEDVSSSGESSDEEGASSRNAATEKNTLSNKKKQIQTSIEIPSFSPLIPISSKSKDSHQISNLSLFDDVESHVLISAETSPSRPPKLMINSHSAFISIKNVLEKVEDLKPQLANDTRSTRSTRNRSQRNVKLTNDNIANLLTGMEELGSDRTLVVNELDSPSFTYNIVLLNMLIAQQLKQYKITDRAVTLLSDLSPEMQDKLNTVSDSSCRVINRYLDAQHTEPIVSTVSSQIALAENYMYKNMGVRKTSPFYRHLLWQLLDKQVLGVSLSRLSSSEKTVDLSGDISSSSSSVSSGDELWLNENDDFTPIAVRPENSVQQPQDHEKTNDFSSQTTNQNSPKLTVTNSPILISAEFKAPLTPTDSPVSSHSTTVNTVNVPSQTCTYPDTFHYDTERNYNAAHCNPLSSYAEWYYPWQLLGNLPYIMINEKPDCTSTLTLVNEIACFMSQIKNDNKINAPASFIRI